MKQISIYSGSSAWENSFFVSTNGVHLNAFPRIVDAIQTTQVNGVDLINHNINSFINQNCVMRVDWFKDHYVHFYFVPGLLKNQTIVILYRNFTCWFGRTF